MNTDSRTSQVDSPAPVFAIHATLTQDEHGPEWVMALPRTDGSKRYVIFSTEAQGCRFAERNNIVID